MIPHAINNFKITRENNPCIMCHGNQAKIGAAKVKGEATAMPATHWTKVDGKLAPCLPRATNVCCATPLRPTYSRSWELSTKIRSQMI